MEFERILKITKHPLKKGVYLLVAENVGLCPFFGTLKECEVMKSKWEVLLKKEFKKLSLSEQKKWLVSNCLI